MTLLYSCIDRHRLRCWCMTCRGYPAKGALSAMRKHGGQGPFGRIPSIYRIQDICCHSSHKNPHYYYDCMSHKNVVFENEVIEIRHFLYPYIYTYIYEVCLLTPIDSDNFTTVSINSNNSNWWCYLFYIFMHVYVLFKIFFNLVHSKYSNSYLKTQHSDFLEWKRLPIKQTGNFVAAVVKTPTLPLSNMD